MNLSEQETCPSESIPFGYCHCGCGEKTTIAPWNHTKFRYIKGQPRSYVAGHGARRKRTPLDDAPFLFENELCRRIPLTIGQYTLVNESDYHDLMQWAWRTVRSPRNPFYASRQEYGTKKLVMMHRYLLNAPDDLEVDHKNLDSLDNRRSNLRLATMSQNMGNRRRNKSNTSGFKGVTILPNGKGRASIRHNGVVYDLGCHIQLEDAAAAYWKKAVELHGEFARA